MEMRMLTDGGRMEGKKINQWEGIRELSEMDGRKRRSVMKGKDAGN